MSGTGDGRAVLAKKSNALGLHTYQQLASASGHEMIELHYTWHIYFEFPSVSKMIPL